MNPFPTFAAACALAVASTSVFSADIGAAPGQNAKLIDYARKPVPDTTPSSAETDNRFRQFRIPAGMKLDLWAAEPMLANPVAFAIDEKGRVFVSETHRYRTSVLDIRHYMFMLEDDLAIRTIEDRTAMVKKHFGPKWTDLAIETEVVRLLEDRSGSGKADFSSIYADEFNTDLDGIASGLLARKGKVWFTNIPELTLLDGTDAKGKAVSRKTLSRGYGVRFSYTGHDMHGLALGPDGRLYFSFGDRGANVLTKEGRRLEYPDEGGVFRCEPDGSDMQVFAHGLRNPQELAFNEYGDLFTGDNDSDAGDRERWVYVVEGSDSGWRVGYQHPPIGNAGPWNMERLWVPDFPGQAAYLLPPVANIADGPSGLVHNPGTGLSPKLDGRFLLAYFKGTSASSGVSSLATRREGAGYVLTAHESFIGNSLVPDVDIGPDGSVYFADWGEGWERTKKGRIFRLTDTDLATSALVRETKRLLAEGFDSTTTTNLVAYLGHADQRVRQEAQFALAGRGAEALPLLKQVALQTTNTIPRLHAIWGLGQIGRKAKSPLDSAKDIYDPLASLLKDTDAEVRAQSLRVLADGSGPTLIAPVIKAMEDPSLRVRSFAAQAVAKLAGPEAFQGIVKLLWQNNGNDRVLQHVGAMALAKSSTLSQRVAASKDVSAAVRKATAVAFRMRGEAEIAPMLLDSDPLIALEAARAINDLPIAEARPALAALGDAAALTGVLYSFAALPVVDIPAGPADAIRDFREGQPLPWTNAPIDHLTPMLLRIVNANFRSGTDADAARLAAIAQRSDVPERIRTEALGALANWATPHQRDRLVGTYRPIDFRTPVAAQSALAPRVPALLLKQRNEAVQTAAAGAISRLQILDAEVPLLDALLDRANAPKARAAMLGTLGELRSRFLPRAVAEVEKDETAEVRNEVGRWLASINKGGALTSLEKTIETAPIGERQAAFVNLAAIQDPRADAFIALWLGKLAAGEAPKELALEILQAATGRTNDNVKTALAAYHSKKGTSPIAKFQETQFGGNAENGRKIFLEKPEAACVRCHKVAGSGGEAGPDLTGIASKRDRAYFLESIVSPNAQIAPGFEGVLITKNNGQQIVGIVRSETPTDVVVVSPDDGVVTVKKSDIKTREKGASGMLEGVADNIGAKALRDVIEYLSTLR